MLVGTYDMCEAKPGNCFRLLLWSIGICGYYETGTVLYGMVWYRDINRDLTDMFVLYRSKKKGQDDDYFSVLV